VNPWSALLNGGMLAQGRGGGNEEGGFEASGQLSSGSERARRRLCVGIDKNNAGLQLNVVWQEGEKRGISAGDMGVGGDEGVAPMMTPSSSTVAPNGLL
jgi:hypothetical protein